MTSLALSTICRHHIVRVFIVLYSCCYVHHCSFHFYEGTVFDDIHIVGCANSGALKCCLYLYSLGVGMQMSTQKSLAHHPKLKDGINSMIIRSAIHWHYLYSCTVLSGFENINWLCFSCNCHPFTECQPTCKIGLGDGATCKRFLSVQDHLPIQNLKQVQR